MTDDKSKHFWTSLTGILTGVASLLTAVVALLTFSVSNCRNEKAEATPQILNLSQCEEITGKWNWFTGGETTLEKDGGVLWVQFPGNALSHKVTGRWSCISTNPRTYNISWQHGITDSVKLSPDRNSLAGSNPAGVQISATRRS
jgi:hypothetical protein